MTKTVSAIQHVGALRLGYDASAWQHGKAANAHDFALTGSC